MDDKLDLVVFRWTTERYATLLNGAGAAKCTHNRWNKYGEYVTYASASRALALLELRVHTAIGPPANSVIAVIRIQLSTTEVSGIAASDLPRDWRNPYDVAPCQTRGSQWYVEQPNKKLLVVPSVVVPSENNYVIRAGIPEVEVVAVERIEFDPRLWESEREDKGRVYTVLT